MSSERSDGPAQRGMSIRRVIGNNAVLVVDDGGQELIALGRGVGFGVRAGDPLPSQKVEQVFLASGGATSGHLSELLRDIPSSCMRAAGRIAELAAQTLPVRVTQSLILPLADHLHFALERAEQGITMEFPLAWEVRNLYPREYEIGQQGVQLAQETMQVQIDPQEAVALAMHLVNAQFATPGLGPAMQMTQTIMRIFEVIDRTFGVEVDRESLSAGRFVTHLRYVFARVSTGRQITSAEPLLFDAVSAAHPEEFACAAKVRYLIEMAFDDSVTADETVYLALHIARLVLDLKENPR